MNLVSRACLKTIAPARHSSPAEEEINMVDAWRDKKQKAPAETARAFLMPVGFTLR
jgi:hypothetical protein